MSFTLGRPDVPGLLQMLHETARGPGAAPAQFSISGSWSGSGSGNKSDRAGIRKIKSVRDSAIVEQRDSSLSSALPVPVVARAVPTSSHDEHSGSGAGPCVLVCGPPTLTHAVATESGKRGIACHSEYFDL